MLRVEVCNQTLYPILSPVPVPSVFPVVVENEIRWGPAEGKLCKDATDADILACLREKPKKRGNPGIVENCQSDCFEAAEGCFPDGIHALNHNSAATVFLLMMARSFVFAVCTSAFLFLAEARKVRKGKSMLLRRRHLSYVTVAAVFVAACIAVAAVWYGMRWSLPAERVLHANLLVVDLMRDYILNHQGAWPRSWAELEALPPRKRAMFQWPEDSQEVRRYVSVDFRAGPDKLAKEPLERFSAVRPREPCYPYKHYPELANLLEALQQTRHGGQKKT